MRRGFATRRAGGTRAAVVVTALALLMIAGGFLAWRAERLLWAAVAAFDDGGRAGAARELRFLKAAFDRVEGQLRGQAGDPAASSLQREQEAVLERMREVAGRVPRASLPPDIRRLVAAPPPPGPADVADPAEPPSTAPAIAVGELHVGLPTAALPAGYPGLTIDPGLTLPLFVEVPRAAPPPRRHRQSRSERPPAERAASRPSQDSAGDRKPE